MRVRQSYWSSLLPSEIKKSIPSHLRLRARIFLLAPVFLWLLLSPEGTALAGSATWNLNPTSGDWNTAANWMPNTVPNGPDDIATFAASSQTDISVSGAIEVNGITFVPGASDFTINVVESVVLTISGTGITNNSGITQKFFSGEVIFFLNSATAGSGTEITNTATGFSLPQTDFFDESSAGEAVIVNEGGIRINGGSGVTYFSGNATAGSATITNMGAAVRFASEGSCIFDVDSTAGNSTLINIAGAKDAVRQGFDFRANSNAGSATIMNFGATEQDALGSQTKFGSTTSAANAILINYGGTAAGAAGGITFFFGGTAAESTLIANPGSAGGGGGTFSFFFQSSGGTARVELFGNGTLDLSLHDAPGMTIGSLEGDGQVLLGANALRVGSNNLSTIFSGVIQDSGSFTKIGTGTLTLANANTYTGGTTIDGGRLWVNNMSDSGTGSGAVQVSAGILGGKGTITGAVTVGTGSGAGALLAPGGRGGRPGNPLTIQSTLTFKSDATYEVGLNSTHAVADKVIAIGVTIDSGALFSVLGPGHGTLTPGTVFTVIDNTAATPIAGTFSNLADGSTFTQGRNTFQVSYEGGDGNDLTLTVIP
jgi:autotransporter-associated beta strand protein